MLIILASIVYDLVLHLDTHFFLKIMSRTTKWMTFLHSTRGQCQIF